MTIFEEDKGTSFNPTKGRRGERPRGIFDSQESNFDQPLAVGREWITKKSGHVLIVDNQEGDRFFVRSGKQNGVLTPKWINNEELQELLSRGKYSLVKEIDATEPDSAKTQVNFSGENTQLIRGGVDVEAGEDLLPTETSKDAVDAVDPQQEVEAPKPAVSVAKARVEKRRETALDNKIASMKRQMKQFESSSKQFDKKATAEQKTERKKLIENLKRDIEDAEKKKADLGKLRAKINKATKKTSAIKQALEDQITKIREASSTSEESTDQYAETLVKGVFGDDVFEREDTAVKTQETEEVVAEPQVELQAFEVAPVSVSTPVVETKKKKKKAKTKQEKPKKNGGPEPASGFTPNEEAEQRLRAERRAARAKEEAKTVKPQEVKAPEVVAEPKVEALVVETPKEESRQAEAEQLNLRMEIPPVEKWEVSEEEPTKGEKLFDKIRRLNEEVAEARAKYVQEDYENTKLWKKLTSLFRITEDQKKGEWRALYEAKTLELQKAELEMVEVGEKDKQRDTRKEMFGLLHYYKLDERMNLINERTQYRAKNLTFWGRIGDTFGALGRGYNRIPTKYKLALSGALIGVSVATGGVLGATAYAAIMTRKVAASAGLAVGAEAGLEKLGERRRAKQTGEEIEQQMSGLTGTTNEAFSNLEEILKKDILSLDYKLQHEKRAKTYRKLVATTLGVAVGSGWLSQIIMDKFGGRELIRGAKEAIMDKLGLSETLTEDLRLPERPKIHSVLSETAGTKASIQDFVNQDITVEKGDSVWKISGRLADQLNLDGAQRTHFVDAIKDKFGDVQLKTGEHINFSEHGINDDFVKHALEDSSELSPEQSARILENNARLSAFTEANPNVRLTDEVTKNILEGKTGIVAEQATNEFRFGPQSDIEYQPTPEGVSPEDIASEYGARADNWYEQIFRAENVQFGQRVLGRDALEMLKLRDVIEDGKLFQQGATEGYKTGLSRQEIINFAKFFQSIPLSGIIFDEHGFFRENPNATILDYLKKVASLTRHGQRIGPYTSL